MRNNCIRLNSDKILVVMAEKNMSVNELLKLAPINSATYQRIMKGNGSNTQTAYKIAKALNCKVKDLI